MREALTVRSPHSASAAGIALLLLVFSSVFSAPCWGQLPAAPYPYPQSFSDRLVGQYNVTVANFHLAAVGTTNTFYGGDECNQIWLTITVGPSFWSAQVQNAFFCDCWPFPACQPPFQAWRFRILNSFLITFIDVSTSAVYVLPTRHNSPDDAGASPTTLVVPKAVDRLQTTASIVVSLTFRRRDRISYYTPEIGPSIECNAAESLGGTHQTYDQSFLWRTLGVKVQRYGVNQSTNMFWMQRKKPFPPFQFTVWNRCCNGGYYYYSCSVNVWASFTSDAMSSSGFVSPWLTAPCCYLTSASTCGCQGHFIELQFYETTRFYSASYKHVDISNPAETVATALINMGDAAIYTPTDAQHPIKFRFLHAGVAYNSTFALLTTNPAARYRRAMYILQPFPIADLWVQITDEFGGIIFQEQETHVPYVDPADEGQVGWLWAIEHMYNRSSKSANVVVKYNRRAKMGNTEEETRARLLMRWLADSGAETAKVISPIPSSILIQPQLLGAVAATAIPQGGLVGTVPAECVLHQNYSAAFYNASLRPFVNLAPRCQQLTVNVSKNEIDPLDWGDFTTALFVALRAVNPMDNASSWFVFYDTFYPRRPANLPVFFDSTLLATLLGFSEIPRLVQQSLDQWKNEYDTLQECFPWWKQEISLFRWQNTRAWVKALTHVFVGSNDVTLLPGPSLWRQGAVPNVAASWTGYNATFDRYEDVKLVALGNISANDELILDYHAESFDTVTYFLRYGDVADSAPDGCTVPDINLVLLGTNQSRTDAVRAYARAFNESYVDSLSRLLNALSVKLGRLPLVVNGLGVEPYVLRAATRILDAERRVINLHLNYGWTEYWDIIAGTVIPPVV